MTRLNSYKVKSIPIKVGNNPSLWRFASVQEALNANTDLIAQFISAGSEQSIRVESPVAVPASEELSNVSYG